MGRTWGENLLVKAEGFTPQFGDDPQVTPLPAMLSLFDTDHELKTGYCQLNFFS